MNVTKRIIHSVVVWVVLVTASVAFIPAVNSVYHIDRGAAFAHQGHYADAVREERLAVRAAPNSAAAHNNLGFYLFKQGKYGEAEKECRLAVRLDPKSSYAHDSLGQVLSHTGCTSEAVAECRQAVQLKPSAVHVNSLAYSLWQAGQQNEARAQWQQVLTMADPEAAADAQKMLDDPAKKTQ